MRIPAASQGRFRGGLERGAGRNSAPPAPTGDHVRRRRWGPSLPWLPSVNQSVARSSPPRCQAGDTIAHRRQQKKDKQTAWPSWRRNRPQREGWCPGLQVTDLPDRRMEDGEKTRVSVIRLSVIRLSVSGRSSASARGAGLPPQGPARSGRHKLATAAGTSSRAEQGDPIGRQLRAEPRCGGSLRPSGSVSG